MKNHFIDEINLSNKYIEVLYTKKEVPITLKTCREVDIIVYEKEKSFFKKIFHEIRKKPEIVSIGTYVSAIPEGHVVYYRQKFLGSKIYMILKNLEYSPTEFYMSDTMKKIAKIPLPMRDLPHYSGMINSLILTKAILKGYTWVHGALIDSPLGGIVVSSYPDVGKTTTAISLLKRGFKVYGDDIIWVDSDGHCASEGVMNISVFTHAERGLFRHQKLMELRRILATPFWYLAPLHPLFST